MNVHDSERMAGILTRMGYRPADSVEEADLILLNTCAVREKSEQKVYGRLGELRALKRSRPELLIALCGCVAQLGGESLFQEGRGADILIGPRAIADLPTRIREARSFGRSRDFSYRRDAVLYDPEEVLHSQAPKAFITVMEGCNLNCTFCIIPTTRGREIYRPAEMILEEVRRLAERGFLEVELLGQTVNAYRDGPLRLPGLLEKIHQIDGIRRIRFTTSHPRFMSRALVDCIRDLPKVCRHLHLPVQSGSDRILKAMGRGYTRNWYLEKVAELREGREVALSTDIIVGFPEETPEDHRETMSLLEEVGYDTVFSFKYSPRPGTPAAAMSGQISREEKTARLMELQERQVLPDLSMARIRGGLSRVRHPKVEMNRQIVTTARFQGLLKGGDGAVVIATEKGLQAGDHLVGRHGPRRLGVRRSRRWNGRRGCRGQIRRASPD